MELLDIAGWFVLLSIAFAVLWKVYGSRQCFRVGTLGTLALWFAVTLWITVPCRNLSPSWSTSPLSILGDTRVVCVPVLERGSGLSNRLSTRSVFSWRGLVKKLE